MFDFLFSCGSTGTVHYRTAQNHQCSRLFYTMECNGCLYFHRIFEIFILCFPIYFLFLRKKSIGEPIDNEHIFFVSMIHISGGWALVLECVQYSQAVVALRRILRVHTYLCNSIRFFDIVRYCR